MPSVNYNTAERIIRNALRDSGLLQEGDDPGGERLLDCMDRLNDLINLWQTQGIKLWLMQSLAAPALVAGQATYLLGPAGSGAKQLKVLEAYFTDQNGISRPLDPLSWNTYGTLSNKNQTGPITSFFVDSQLLNTAITYWLVPDAGAALGSVQLLTKAYSPNLVNLTDSLVFPNEWFMALHWGLADEICTGQPQAIVQRCEQKALQYRTALEGFDVEEAPTSFAPNMEGQASSFR